MLGTPKDNWGLPVFPCTYFCRFDPFAELPFAVFEEVVAWPLLVKFVPFIAANNFPYWFWNPVSLTQHNSDNVTIMNNNNVEAQVMVNGVGLNEKVFSYPSRNFYFCNISKLVWASSVVQARCINQPFRSRPLLRVGGIIESVRAVFRLSIVCNYTELYSQLPYPA